MNKVASLAFAVILLATGLTNTTTSAWSRNPLKPTPGDSSSPGDGGVGSSHPNNALTLDNYQTVCQSKGKVTIDVKTLTVNGHRQAFLHTTAQQSNEEEPNAALAYVLKGNSAFLDFPVQRPISFQLIDGQTVLITVTYSTPHSPEVTSTFVRPDSPFNHGNALPLTQSGSNSFTIPVGAGHAAIPKGAKLINLLFQTICDQSCTTYTADLNNLQINGLSVGIKTESKSCGSDCSE